MRLVCDVRDVFSWNPTDIESTVYGNYLQSDELEYD